MDLQYLVYRKVMKRIRSLPPTPSSRSDLQRLGSEVWAICLLSFISLPRSHRKSGVHKLSGQREPTVRQSTRQWEGGSEYVLP